ncbi:MAG: nitrate reductase molybdenum cofactor assembly chaperone [Bacillota bacterium]|nr:nitrate reductase molybdenum cofactor assembly chaperone [Bacillota bacterium]
MDDYQRIFLLASILLQNPEKEWFETSELEEEIELIENTLVKILFKHFLYYLKSKSFVELCTAYTQTFDFSDKTTLYLTYPIFRESPDRGKGLLKLKEEFQDAGYPLEVNELPDYFPVILEFCSLVPIETAKKMLRIHRKAIDQLLKELTILDNPYQTILQGCIQEIETILNKQKAS